MSEPKQRVVVSEVILGEGPPCEIRVYATETPEQTELAALRSRSASDAALIERLAGALQDVLAGVPVRDADEMLNEAEARAALDVAEGRKGLCRRDAPAQAQAGGVEPEG